jgi:hypothetical protein
MGFEKKRRLPTLPGDMEGTHKLEQLLLHLGLAEWRAHPHFPTRILNREKHKSIDNANIKILLHLQTKLEGKYSPDPTTQKGSDQNPEQC